MKMMKKFAAAVCAAAMAFSGMTALNASALDFYQFQTNETHTFHYAPAMIGRQPDERYGRTDFTVVYQGRAKDDFKITGFKKDTGKFRHGKTYPCGDANLDGVISAADAQIALELASLYMAGEDPRRNGYSIEQCWTAAVTHPCDRVVTVEDAQIILNYVTYVKNAKKKNLPYFTRIESWMVEHDRTASVKWLTIDNQFVLVEKNGKTYTGIVNVNCKNTWRTS